MAQLRNIVITLSLMLFFASCGEQSRQQKEYLSVADSLIDVNPDSVYRRLLADSVRFQSANENIRMRYLLLTQKALNKSKATFHSDSIIRTVVNYYADNGTANEQMLSRYILACAYVDLNEAPRALDCFYEALSCADTTAADCDYTTMNRIVGQMQWLFDKQGLPREEIDLKPLAEKLAWRAKDTLEALRQTEYLVGPYYLLNEYDSVLYYTSLANAQMKKYGYNKSAAAVYPTAIYILLKRKQYHEADSLIRIFENESDMFNNGEIYKGCEVYYYSKGMYYQGVNKLDSAELMYRKTIAYGFSEEGYNGLLSLYRQIDNKDSIAKYAILHANANDSNAFKRQTEAVAIQNGLYNYERNERLAKQFQSESEGLKYERNLLFILVASILIVATMVIYIIMRNRRQAREDFKQSYKLLLTRYNSVKADIKILEDNKEEWQKIKNEELQAIRKEMKELNESVKAGYDILATSKIVSHLREMVSPFSKEIPTRNDWDMLLSQFKMYVPKLYQMMTCDISLSDKERNVIMLIYLNFKECEIASLLNVSSSRTSNIKTSINNKLFSENTARSVRENIQRLKK